MPIAAVTLAERLRAAGRVPGPRGAMAWDFGLTVALAAVSLVPQLGGNGIQLGQLPERSVDAWAIILILGQCLPLALRRRWPVVCLTLVACSFAAYQSMGFKPNIAGVGLFVALYSAGAYAQRFRRVSASAATAAYVVLAVTLHGLDSPESPLDFVAFYVVLLACWAAGAKMRAWRAGEAERRREAARLAIAQDRARIARELHDVVTHHVTAIVVQSDAAQYLVDSAPERVKESLRAISGTGRGALEELRYLLGVLDGPAARVDDLDTDGAFEAKRSPTVRRLRELVERTRLVGQPVALFEDGDRNAISDGSALVTYRVVQEALTNAVKHASSRPTEVRVEYGGEICVDVTTEGSSVGTGAFKAGRGLTGLSERVRASGGELTAGNIPGGGFRVHARIPSGASV
ncbi:MAG: histidine kinase [Nakamurella sp.]